MRKPCDLRGRRNDPERRGIHVVQRGRNGPKTARRRRCPVRGEHAAALLEQEVNVLQRNDLGPWSPPLRNPLVAQGKHGAHAGGFPTGLSPAA